MNQMIELDSFLGERLTFTSDNWQRGSWLWQMGKDIVLSMIMSKKKGSLKKLVHTILEAGYNVIIPAPIGYMREIVKKNGYTQQFVRDKIYGPIEIWRMNAIQDPD